MLLTVEQAAERLGTSVRFIRRLRAEHRIAVVKLGKHVRIDSTDLDAYVQAGRPRSSLESRWPRHHPSAEAASMTGSGVDRELLAVLVALEPLDDRKWGYVSLTDRTFLSDRMLDEQSWSSGERILIDVAASLWNIGTVDLGHIACALSGRHPQAVMDATAIRSGQNLSSNIDRAVSCLGTSVRFGVDQSHARTQEERPSRALDTVTRVEAGPRHGRGR